jgi:hypothetical protein
MKFKSKKSKNLKASLEAENEEKERREECTEERHKRRRWLKIVSAFFMMAIDVRRVQLDSRQTS